MVVGDVSEVGVAQEVDHRYGDLASLKLRQDVGVKIAAAHAGVTIEAARHFGQRFAIHIDRKSFA